MREATFESDSSSTKGRRGKLFAAGLAAIAISTAVAAECFSSADSRSSSTSGPRTHHVRPLPEEKAVLTFAPEVPPPIKRKFPVKLRVDMDVQIKEMPIDELYKYEFWTFSGGVPGPFIRARVGDTLEVHLKNNDPSGMLHNLDFHAVTGPGGGAPLLTVEKDEMKNANFKLLSPGLFIYHCAVNPVGAHVGNGMYGLILVEPEEGLPPVDKEFYVLQSEVYAGTEPSSKGSNVLPIDLDRAIAEQPNYVMFNGRVGSLTGENALKAKTNDRVRMFVGNAGPNLVSSFHVIGTIFDKVYREGDLVSPPARGLQTTLVPAGGATVVEIDLPVPGNFTIVDHSIWRIEKGCVGFLQVAGPPRPDLYDSALPPRNCPSCKIHP